MSQAAQEEKVRRLANVRQEIDGVSSKASRLKGQIDEHERRQKDLSAQCKKEFNVGIDELPGLIEEFDKDAEEALTEAESILGLKGDASAPAKQSDRPEEADEDADDDGDDFED